MKKIIVILIFAFIAKTSIAQEKKVIESSKSNIETFSEKAGSFSKKEAITIGKVKGLTVEVLKITDIISNRTETGIRVSGTYNASYGSSDKTGYLDADEVDNFLKTFDYINEKVFPNPIPDNSTEYNFYSRGGFSGGAFVSNKTKWKGYVQLEKYDSDSDFFFDADDYKALGDLFVQAKAKM